MMLTMQASEHASLLETLSDRLLSDFPLEFWRKVFLGPGYERIRFERETVTFLCTDMLDPEWTPEEIGMLAARYGGRVERCDQRTVLAFPQARKALELALLLQRTCAVSLPIALLTANCTMAVFELDGKPHRLATGNEVRQAETWAERTTPGSIHISAQTYRCLGPANDWQPRAALIATELQGEEVTSAAITLAPSRNAAMSTFAGLGLT
jgi:hypothetical protein